MKFIAIKTDDGTIKGKLAFYCRMLHVSRQGFYKYLSVKDRPWKYQTLADTMLEIHAEDVCNDTYGWCCIIKVDTLFSRILIYNHNQYENGRKTYGTESKIL